MLHKEFFGFMFLAFVAWIFLAASPTSRIENACRPLGWVGNGTVSLSSLVVPSQQTKVQGWFDKVEYGCRFITWRLFYQDAYNNWLATQGRAPVVNTSDVEGAESKSEAASASAAASTAASAPPAASSASASVTAPPVKP